MSVARAIEWTISDRLRKSRREAKLDQEHMAEVIGVSRPTISAWECGRSEPNATQLIRWAKATSTTVADLVGESTSMRKANATLRALPTALDHRYSSPTNQPPVLAVVAPDSE